MNRRLGRLVAGSAAVTALLAACGTAPDGGAPASSGVATTASTAAVATGSLTGGATNTASSGGAATRTIRPIPNRDLVAALLRPEDSKQALESEGFLKVWWREDQGMPSFKSRVELCSKANEETVYLRDNLHWPALTRQIAMEGMYVTVQESLVAGQPDEMQGMFGVLKEGLRVCLGVPEKSPHRTLTSEPYEVATSADDHYAIRYLFGENQARIDVLFRDGGVLGHIVLAGVSRDSASMMQALVARAIAKLPTSR